MRTVLSLVALSACSPPDAGQLRNQVDLLVDADDAATTQRFIDTIDSAEETLQIALPQNPEEGAIPDFDPALGDAIISAANRGVEVEVISDVDAEDDPVVEALDDAGITMRLADPSIAYFEFATNEDVGWASHDVMMSHAFVLADTTRYVNANRLGGLDGQRVVFQGQNEDLGLDVSSEFQQILGGTDCAAMNAYSSSMKNIADNRWRYGTPTDADLEMWFGPQERLIKRIIDSVYGARVSVKVLTDEFANDGLAAALQAKAEDGFDISVVVGPRYNAEVCGAAQPGEVLFEETDDVFKQHITDNISVPTIVLVDIEGGNNTTRRAYVLSHDLVSAGRYYRGNEVRNDQLIDGNLWVIDDWGAQSPMFDALIEVWESHLGLASEIPSDWCEQ